MERATAERDARNRAVISGTHVHLTDEAARVILPPQSGDCTPRVELVRSGDQVRAIDIICSCGKRIHLECEY